MGYIGIWVHVCMYGIYIYVCVCVYIYMWYGIYMCVYMYIYHTHIMHTMIYYSAIRKDDVAICRDMNGLGKHYAKWNKPDRERQILYNMTYMWNLKNSAN